MTSCFSRRPVERRAMFFFFFLFLSVMGSSSGVCVDGACVVMYYLPSFFLRVLFRFLIFLMFSDSSWMCECVFSSVTKERKEKKCSQS